MTESAVDGRRYNGVSAEARRIERRSRFLDAALTVAARDGIAAVSARSLCAEAGLHARYFREAFVSSDEALEAAFDECAAAMMTAVAEELAAVPSSADDAVVRRVRAGVHASLAAMDSDPRWAALLVGADTHAGLRERREALVDLLAVAMAAQAKEVLDDPPADEDALLSARLIAVGGLHLGIAARSGRIAASPARVEQIMVASILGNRDLAVVLRQLRAMSEESARVPE
ncbi:TetR family transcriptional regulator OS=Tsukamurella paurometabola (strain ATCC 8368 / DSM/ CCUG 35730 / CIP 100753 / JCM 10117 / KCTC 9821 / NBRC 16120/ NCIMB 702349 / NCTC 13040) OX=521096 GN=Tpau_1283 PE=4 SV=1 [Tsukamurella paurometabola]|uniref:TetR family transcriptional regulator n=1 Tax=Tsukamurella paurometabola (strain ATCC 8368 / DSM 20162 / CCUG 35730 / CIP 100753 / JCM 10117 / KCTC 9821 / NBRC 16120 / NCIMB 702349 / NCTC 13040) TaxID=521096 RepID=D5UWP1_TSUPD|nr:TetR family transcriptional regulator [Tsukamurella paurometabola]ADG77913.1 TetR family transcriptional regulator [Tsukamurella paurometabola DSM 20162]SUP29332.1 Uncharacterised protein [Tsukamurella paurometabola]